MEAVLGWVWIFSGIAHLHSPIKNDGVTFQVCWGGGGTSLFGLKGVHVCATEQGIVFRFSSLNWAYNLTMNRVSF